MEGVYRLAKLEIVNNFDYRKERDRLEEAVRLGNTHGGNTATVQGDER